MLSAILIGTGVWGFFIYSDRQAEKKEVDTYNRLVDQLADKQTPKGDAYSVVVMGKMMKNRNKDVAANALNILKVIEGPGVKDMIVRQIGETSGGTRVNFINVATLRKLPKATKAMITAARSSQMATRDAALNGIIELAQPDDLDAILGLLKADSLPADTRLFAEAVFAAAFRDQGSRGSVRLISALKEFPDGEGRGIILQVLGRLGGDEALAILEKELTGTSEIQRFAILGLNSWPNGKSAEILSRFAENTTDDSLKELALKGFVEVVGRSGDLTGEQKVTHLISAIKSVRSNRTKRSLFNELSRIPDEAALAFVDEIIETSEDEATISYAEFAERTIADLLAKVIDIDDLEVILDAEKATLSARQGIFFNRIENTIHNWDDLNAWVIWHVRIPEPGHYLIDVIQAHEGKEKNTYEIHFGGSTLPCTVKTTPSREEFENVEAGTVEIKEAGLYELVVKPTEIKSKPLMVLRGVALVNDG